MDTTPENLIGTVSSTRTQPSQAAATQSQAVTMKSFLKVPEREGGLAQSPAKYTTLRKDREPSLPSRTARPSRARASRLYLRRAKPLCSTRQNKQMMSPH